MRLPLGLRARLGPPRLTAETRSRLAMAESFYRGIRPWLLVRDEDAVLIVPPNRVYKLGGSATGLLGWLDQGGQLSEMPGLALPGRAEELLTFFEELRAAYEGRAPAGAPAGATGVEAEGRGFGRVAYDFSFTRLPILGELALTYRCNERCLFCYAGCGSQKTAGGCGGSSCSSPSPQDAAAEAVEAQELSTEEWKGILRILKTEAKIPFFSFTGGEPLLRGDLEELAAYARELGLRANLITNGSLASPGRAAALKAAGIDTAQVSLESPEAAVHDALCGVDGSWERTTAGIRALREAGISVQTNSTLTAWNRESLLELPELLVSLGVKRFSMNLFIPAGRGLSASELFVSYTEAGPVVDALRRRAHRASLSFFWYSPTPYCIYNPVARGLGNKSCAAADGLVHVNPHGEVLPCSSWPESLGSLLEAGFATGRPAEGGFRDIWFSERASFFKEKRFAPKACSGCDSFVACQGACPLYWSYAGEAELSKEGSA